MGFKEEIERLKAFDREFVWDSGRYVYRCDLCLEPSVWQYMAINGNSTILCQWHYDLMIIEEQEIWQST
jgi:hypothetical protein